MKWTTRLGKMLSIGGAWSATTLTLGLAAAAWERGRRRSALAEHEIKCSNFLRWRSGPGERRRKIDAGDGAVDLDPSF